MFVDKGDLVIRDASKHIGQPGLRIDAVQLRCINEGLGDGGRAATAFRSGEQSVLVLGSDAAHGPFGGIVIQLQNAVVEIRPELL